MKWVLINKLCEIKGYTKNAVYAYIKKGIWRDGIHHVKRQGRRYFNINEKYNSSSLVNY